MRHDGDFAAYLAARWPTLVRTLVLLGAPQSAAEAATRSAMARCHRRWSRIRNAADLEAEVYGALLLTWAARRRQVPDEAGSPLPLERELDRLTRELRTAVVLRFVAGLSESQAAGAIDGSAGQVQDRTVAALELIGLAGEPEADGFFREAAESVEVLAPPLPEVLTEAAAQRRRSLRVGIGVSVLSIALLLGLVGLGTWVGTRTPSAPAATDATTDAPRVRSVENRSEVAWWANGVLHLPHVDVELARVSDLVEVGGGAVYGDSTGGVFFVTGDGTVSELGRTSPREPLVASDETGLAAWVDVRGDTPQLVVYDVAAGEVLAHRDAVVDPGQPLEGQARPIAFDGESVFYADAGGEHEWRVRSDVAGPVARRGLVDVVQKVQVFQLNRRTIQIVQPFFSVSYAVRGQGAQVSPGATYVLTRRPGTAGSDEFGTVRIYDARSGDRLWTGLRRQDVAVAASLGPDDEVHYVIAREQDVPRSGEFVRSSFSGPYELRTCHIGEQTCFTVAQFPHTGQLPVLAR